MNLCIPSIHLSRNVVLSGLPFHGLQRGYLFQFISECAYEYIRGKAVGKARFKKLPETLRKIVPLSEEYRSFEQELRKIATHEGCQPEDLDNRRRWPKFKMVGPSD